MKIGKIFLLSSVALMAVACQDKKDEPKPTPTPTPGEEVCFGGELGDNGGSRTIYGDEVEVKEGGKVVAWSFPILWLKDDKVFIASPQCREGMNQGNFGLPTEADHRNYAGSFIKESGTIQWGSTNADFYSIYPQRSDNTEYTITTASDFSENKNATFNLNMPETQFCKVEATSGSPVMSTADMRACFMYAKSADVENGTSPVYLHYKPLSTAIRFKLRGPNTKDQTSTVSRIRLIGPSGAHLTGKFQVNLNGTAPVITPVSGQTSNIVTVYASYDTGGAYLKLAYQQEIELSAFIIPMSGMSVNESWSIEVTLSSGKQVTKALKPTEATQGYTNLTPGKIHRLGYMPYLPLEDIDLSKWLEYVPRNVYLSEISLPGSWNSLNKDFQTLAASGEGGATTTEAISKETINQQYALGCRAFHLDTRFRRINATSTDFTNLGIANGGETAKPLDEITKRVMKEGACPLFSEALGYITANVKPNEYMVVMCTFAQDSYEGADWRQKVSDACASNNDVFDASQITPNTTVKDVLGKVIVIVNCEGTVPSISGSKCLFVNAPLTLSASTFAGGYPTEALYKKDAGSTGVSLSYVHAQMTSNLSYGINTQNGEPDHSTIWAGDKRGYAPSLTERQTIGNNILNFSMGNVGKQDYAHNSWLYFGLGGYEIKYARATVVGWKWNEIDDSQPIVAANLNNWINGKVTAMDTNKKYYPVGIVLMNNVKESGTGWNSPETIKNIVWLNNKYHKAYDPTKPAWPIDGNVQSVAPGYSSGVHDNNQNAISSN